MLGAWLWNQAGSVRSLNARAYVSSVAFRSDGRVLASGSTEATIKLWDPLSGRFLRTLAASRPSFWVTFSPDGKWLVSSSAGLARNDEQAVSLWDAASGREVRTFGSHAAFISAAVFSPDGRVIASVSQVTRDTSSPSTIHFWDVASGEEVRTLAGHGPVAFSPDGRLFALSDARAIRWLDLSTGKEAGMLPTDSSIQSIAFSPDGKLLSARTSYAFHVWDMASAAELPRLQGDAEVRAMAFSPNSRILALGDAEREIRLWDIAGGRVFRTLTTSDTITSLTFSPDGRLLAAGVEDHIEIWTLTK